MQTKWLQGMRLAKKPPEPTETLYQITLNEQQVSTISKACELLLRIRLGQFEDILWKVFPDKFRSEENINMEAVRSTFDTLNYLLRNQRSNSGSDTEWSESSEISWDIHQVLRNRLALDGEPPTDSWNVDLNEPLPKSRMKLVQIERVGKGDKLQKCVDALTYIGNITEQIAVQVEVGRVLKEVYRGD